MHELKALEAEHPDLRHAGFADAARRRPARRGLRHRRAPAADAQPRQRLRRRRAARLRRARAQGPGARGDRPSLRRRAEDRRPQHRADLRGRPAGARRHARRRRARRRRHAERPHRSARFRCRCKGGPRDASRSAARSICRKKNFERINKEREEAGEPLFANPRNTAAGHDAQSRSGAGRQARPRGVDVSARAPADASSRTPRC